MISNHILRRSHRWGSVIKNGVLRSFAKFAGKHLCQSFFCNKVAGQACNSIKKDRLWHSYFPVNFAKFLRTPFLQNISRRLLLQLSQKKIMFVVTRPSLLKSTNPKLFSRESAKNYRRPF